MKKLLSLAIGVLTPLLIFAQNQPLPVKVGDKAPAFTEKDENGQAISLSDFEGKKVVLYFYPKDDTPGCTAQACNLRDNYKTLQEKGYVILGISADSEADHQKFKEKYNLPFPLLADTDRSMHEKYGTWQTRMYKGKSYEGTARITFIINEKGVIEDIIEKVDTKEHTFQILN
ncbi:thioredoxin-dependent thiol peroxidase [Algivirga pacifica]|uniref:thioredoxin-dependent peroxiredoxin n=1 Tax=Algivirga pacifica TaxID=1162670 RepID=A0ABP9DI97_9BACT